MSIFRRLPTLLFVLSACSLPASAWESSNFWSTDTVTMRMDATDFPTGNDFSAAIERAVAAWNENPSHFRFDLDYGDTATGPDNGENEIWITSFAVFTGVGVETPPARMLSVFSTASGEFEETDIVFNAYGVTWETADSPLSVFLRYGGSDRYVMTTALHELGHALGLSHENAEYNIMGVSYETFNVNNGVVEAYPGEDASDGAVAIYGLDGVDREDVSVVHWEFDNADGEYSAHEFTDITCASTETACSFSRSIVVNNSDSDNDGDASEHDWIRTKVARGRTIGVEFTYENNGSHVQTPRLKFVLSGDGNIETTDLALATYSVGLGRGNVYTIALDVTIPNSAPLGNKYLGVIVDPDDDIVEVNEDNNATYLLIEVTN